MRKLKYNVLSCVLLTTNHLIKLLKEFFYLNNIRQKKVKEENHRAEEMKIQAAVGFRHVIDLLASEQKLIVGYNCFLGTNDSLNP